MPGVREFFETPKGQGVIGVFVVLALGAAAYSMFGGKSDTASGMANERTFIDAKTGQTFDYALKVGDKMPVSSPSGQAGYPAESCFWTKDGKTKTTPTYVLLGPLVGKPGPTFCPDCGRLVTPHNPLPSSPTAKAPPTKEEYEARHRGGATAPVDDRGAQ